MTSRAALAASLFLVSAGCTGCATIFAGPRQSIAITSSAPGATILVDGKAVGVTPLNRKVWRRSAHMVVVKGPGGTEAAQALTPKLGSMFWVDLILFWPSLILDLPLGSVYKLEPGVVHASLAMVAAAPPRPQLAGRLSTIAVADLDAQGVSGTDAAVISDVLRNRLINTAGFKVVEKNNMNRVLSEQAFQQTGCTSQECAVKLGKVLNVQGMVVGSFGKLLGRYIVSARLVEVETGSVVLAEEAKGDTVDALQQDIEAMAGRIGAAAR